MPGGASDSEVCLRQEKRKTLSLTIQRFSEGQTIIRTQGGLDRETNSQLCAVIADELLYRPAQLVLQLTEVSSVEKAGVDCLLSASGLAGEADISFCLVAGVNSPVVRALDRAGLMERFEIFPTICAALDRP
jgi:anti-anti-sigma factor